MERTHYLNNPFWARFIRFYPIQWNEQIAMRVGVFGCPYTEQCMSGYFRVNENSNCVENIAYQKDAWANVRRPNGGNGYSQIDNSEQQVKNKRARNPIRSRSYMANLVQEGQPGLAVDGNEDNSLNNCAVMDNYYTDRPTFVIDLGRLATVGGLVIKTWQGKGQDSNFAYRDYMYGLDRFSVYVDRRPFNNQHLTHIQNLMIDNDDYQSKNMSTIHVNGSIVVKESKPAKHIYSSKLNSFQQRVKLSEMNLCNFVTRNNYAIFAPQIHLQCNKPLTGRYVYIQADGRSNRWSRMFSAVICEAQVYEF
jgi:hypothetical protein